jgi:hypothetical protein
MIRGYTVRIYLSVCHCLTRLQQQGRYEDDFVPTESSLQALEGDGDFMMNFFTTVGMPIRLCVCMDINKKKFLGRWNRSRCYACITKDYTLLFPGVNLIYWSKCNMVINSVSI